MVHQMGRLAEALVAQRALVGLLARVDALVPRELRQVLEGLLADGAERSGKLRAWSLGPGLETRKRLVRSAQQCGGRERPGCQGF